VFRVLTTVNLLLPTSVYRQFSLIYEDESKHISRHTTLYTEIIKREQTFQCWHFILSTIRPLNVRIRDRQAMTEAPIQIQEKNFFNGEKTVLKTLQAKCPFFWNMSPRHWIIGARRFERACWSHLPGSTFIRHSTLEDGTTKQSRKVRYQSHSEAETNPKSSETSSVEGNVETWERNQKGMRINENDQELDEMYLSKFAGFYQTK
jgi:hypothetical protein